MEKLQKLLNVHRSKCTLKKGFQILLTSLVLLLTACGGGSSTSPTVDTDNDSVFDNVDSCINTPSTLINNVNSDGCHLDEITDTDGDAIYNAYDQCLTTPELLKTSVNGDGCHLDEITDTDGDGKFNVVDQCINTPNNLISGINNDGCHLDEMTDTDGDAIYNAYDQCLTTPESLKTNVNSDGCHLDEITDTDNDGKFNVIDQCINTPNNLISGINNDGCHLDETTDTDGDAIYNAYDQCLTTPESLKTSVNGDGCHLDEISDTDNDGVVNSTDACPNTIKRSVNIDTNGCDDGRYYHTIKAINAGYLEYTTVDGQFFERDVYYHGFMKEEEGAQIKEGKKVIGLRDILNTEDDSLFRFRKYNEDGKNVDYRIPLQNNTNYYARLYFAEMQNKLVGSSVFDVFAENEMILANVDIKSAAGEKDTAYIALTQPFSIDDGLLNLTLTPTIGDASISAIEIVQILDQTGDVDNDGINNIEDNCLYTPPEFIAQIYTVDGNTKGCAESELDEDNDDVLNPIDICPQTPNFPDFPTTNQLVDIQGCSAADLDNDNDNIKDDIDLCNYTPDGVSVNNKGCSTAENLSLTNPFQEENGLIVIEMESTNHPVKWVHKTGNFSVGNGYLEWEGSWNSDADKDKSGGAEIIIDVNITNTGIYHFQWRSVNALNLVRDAANDSWVTISSDNTQFNFYGQGISKQDNLDSIICPKTQLLLNTCSGTDKEGKNGYFKVYRNGRPTYIWNWKAWSIVHEKYTHTVHMDFQTPGIYQIKIMARTAGHAIDRVVLHRTEENLTGPTMSAEAATDISLPESKRMP